MRHLVRRGSKSCGGKPRDHASSANPASMGSARLAVAIALAVMASGAAQAQQAEDKCSGLACLFGQANPPVARLAPVTPAPADPVDAAVTNPAADKTMKASKPARPVITIAARATEMGRLKGLAAALPRERIRIVPLVDASEAVNADFTVSEALGAAGTNGKARLFTEPLHIVAGEKIHTVADLAGKVVGFAGNGGPGENAARQAFASLNIKVTETPLDLANALDGLSTGDIDAVVVLAPQPVAQLEAVKAPGLHLLAWPDGGTLPEGAIVTSIEGDHYPALAKPGQTIRALGLDAVLTLSAKGAKVPAARAFLASLSQNAVALSKHGFDLLRAESGRRSGNQLASAERR